MARRIIDISVPIANHIQADPAVWQPKIEYFDHDQMLESFLSNFPGLRREDLPDGKSFAFEIVHLSTHVGTHVDAPWHYHPTMDNGERAITIDEVDLDWFMQPGVKLDFRHFPDGHLVTASEIQQELDRIGHTLRPLEIVVVNTAAGRAFGNPDYIHRGCGMGREATLFLTDKGIKVVGTDAWGWDPPLVHVAEKFRQTGDPSLVWEGHKAGRFRGYCQIEKLHNLEQLPPSGFTISCFPVKVSGASGGWTRAVAILDE